MLKIQVNFYDAVNPYDPPIRSTNANGLTLAPLTQNSANPRVEAIDLAILTLG